MPPKKPNQKVINSINPKTVELIIQHSIKEHLRLQRNKLLYKLRLWNFKNNKIIIILNLVQKL